MKFLITRTSLSFDSPNPPCEGAVSLTPNAKVEEYDEFYWSIEINTLEELLALQEKVADPIILMDAHAGSKYPQKALEIYDTRRE